MHCCGSGAGKSVRVAEEGGCFSSMALRDCGEGMIDGTVIQHENTQGCPDISIFQVCRHRLTDGWSWVGLSVLNRCWVSGGLDGLTTRIGGNPTFNCWSKFVALPTTLWSTQSDVTPVEEILPLGRWFWVWNYFPYNKVARWDAQAWRADFGLRLITVKPTGSSNKWEPGPLTGMPKHLPSNTSNITCSSRTQRLRGQRLHISCEKAEWQTQC